MHSGRKAGWPGKACAVRESWGLLWVGCAGGTARLSPSLIGGQQVASLPVWEGEGSLLLAVGKPEGQGGPAGPSGLSLSLCAAGEAKQQTLGGACSLSGQEDKGRPRRQRWPPGPPTSHPVVTDPLFVSELAGPSWGQASADPGHLEVDWQPPAWEMPSPWELDRLGCDRDAG